MPVGAAAEDWARLQRLGLTADLLPVVSDTTATIDPDSKIRDIGKTPSRFNSRGNVVGIAAWTQHQATERQVGSWSRDPRLGICLQTRRVRAIDVDIGDGAVSAQVRSMVEMVLGPLPCRRCGNSGKLLLAFEMPGEFTKRILRTEHGIIEFLANGQQFIAFGTHPSGVRYEWDGLDMADALGQFPEVSAAEFEALWDGLRDAWGKGDEVAARTGVLPSVPRSRLDMHGDPVAAWLDENDWVREWDRDGRIHVRCPWEHEHTSDSGPTATSWFPAGVGGFAQGHFKCLHAHCAARTDEEFKDAIGFNESQFEVLLPAVREDGAAVGPGQAAEDEPWPVFARDRQGRIEATVDNVVKALARPDITGARLAYDEFKDAVMVGWGDTWRPMRDVDYVDLRVALERRGFKPVSKEMVRDVALKVADLNRFDSAIQWAEGLVWDGVERVETFFPRLFGVPDTPYTRAVGLYLWTALAGRCLVPGIKADMVPVLISGQGTRKTSMVEALAPTEDAFVEINLEHRDDNLARSLRGKLVGELAELRGLASKDSEAIKAWISRRVEEWTPKFIEHATRYPRRLINIGTGNKHEFLDDETGERRWLPLTVGTVDVEAVKAERDQLWAEGVVLFRRGGVQWREAQNLATAEHAAFKVRDPWHERVEQWLADDGLGGGAFGNARFSTRDVLVGALRFADPQIQKTHEMRVARVLALLGYERVQRWEQGKNCKKWERAAIC